MLISSAAKGLSSSKCAQLQCKWLAGAADKKSVGQETVVQEPSIKLKLEETLKKRYEVPKATGPNHSTVTSFYLDTHDSVIQLQNAGHFCMCVLALPTVHTRAHSN